MGKFKKEGKKKLPEFASSSMADIVFMFLFFFMVITTMRESDVLVNQNLPSATAIQKLEKKDMVVNIHIGQPISYQKLGTEPRVQLDDQLSEVRDVIRFIEAEKVKRGENAGAITWSLKVDQSVKMGIVTDVKQEMRKASAFKINYTALQEMKK